MVYQICELIGRETSLSLRSKIFLKMVISMPALLIFNGITNKSNFLTIGTP
jgi:hypothetical protein